MKIFDFKSKDSGTSRIEVFERSFGVRKELGKDLGNYKDLGSEEEFEESVGESFQRIKEISAISEIGSRIWIYRIYYSLSKQL